LHAEACKKKKGPGKREGKEEGRTKGKAFGTPFAAGPDAGQKKALHSVRQKKKMGKGRCGKKVMITVEVIDQSTISADLPSPPAEEERTGEVAEDSRALDFATRM